MESIEGQHIDLIHCKKSGGTQLQKSRKQPSQQLSCVSSYAFEYNLWNIKFDSGWQGHP